MGKTTKWMWSLENECFVVTKDYIGVSVSSFTNCVIIKTCACVLLMFVVDCCSKHGTNCQVECCVGGYFLKESYWSLTSCWVSNVFSACKVSSATRSRGVNNWKVFMLLNYAHTLLYLQFVAHVYMCDKVGTSRWSFTAEPERIDVDGCGWMVVYEIAWTENIGTLCIISTIMDV